MALTGPELVRHEFGWVERAQRYRDLTTGRFVSEDLILGELDRIVVSSADTMKGITQQLIDGQLSLPEWQLQMEREIKLVNRQAGVIARGGLKQMSAADWGRIGFETKRQYQYLRNFATEIASGKQPLNGRALVRAGLYGEAGRGTYWEMQRKQQKRRGKTEERRVLGVAEHCEATENKPGCVDLADLGWQPIGTLPRIGEATCVTHCKCKFLFR
jgi:hypothetical protein